MIIGITGFHASGKTVLAEHLEKKGFQYISANKVFSKECEKRGLSNDRENLFEIANELRETLGTNAFVIKAMENFDLSKDTVIESLRNPGEVEELKKYKDCYLIGAKASLKTRFERANKRNRDKDSVNFEAFKKSEEKELGSDNANSQQLIKTYEMKEFEIINDSTIENLQEKMDIIIDIIKSIKTPFDRFEKSYETIYKFGDKILQKSFKDKYFLKVAQAISLRSTCLSVQHGAIIAKDEILSSGYVGAPRGVNSSFDMGFCLRRKLNIPSGQQYEICRSVHAEQNAIINASRTGSNIFRANFYMWSIRYDNKGNKNIIKSLPCFICKKMIINAGIKYFYGIDTNGRIIKYDVSEWQKSWSEKDMLDDKISYK